MMALIYLTKVVISSSLLFAYYFFFLRNKQFHQYNRYYLLISVAFSALFPLLQIPVLFHWHTSENVLLETLKVMTVSGWENEFVITAHRSALHALFNFQNGAVIVYLSGLAVFLIYAVRSALYIHKLTGMYVPERIERVRFYHTHEPGTPFSFFNHLFWNDKIEHVSEHGKQILRHELFHIRAGHSYDILFMECLTILFWFNPFFHLFKKEIKAIHEFLADEHASTSIDKYDYAELLVTEAINNRKACLSNPFFHNQIKRRITMIIKNNPTNFSYMRRIMAMPLLFMLFCAFAFKTSGPFSKNLFNKADRITVVIDAGHGGADAGATGLNGISEKDLALSIAQKIKNLSGTYGIDVIMTRDGDVLPGNASNKDVGSRNRTDISEKSNADVFVSIHLNAKGSHVADAGSNGFDIYVSGQNKQYDKSKLLGSAITHEIKNTYRIASELKESNAVWVLKSTSVPAILIECGYLTDQDDVNFISNTQNQEKIAHDILKGIVTYYNSLPTGNQSTSLPVNLSDTVSAKAFADMMQKGEVVSFTSNSETDLVVGRLKNGESVITRQSELLKVVNKNDPSPSQDYGRIFTKTEIEASYPGGAEGWIAYLKKNLQYPKDAIKQNIEGTVVVEFIVDKSGKLSKIEAISGPAKGGLRDEGVRLIKNSGTWLPAKQNGLLVTSYRKQPFTFKLKE